MSNPFAPGGNYGGGPNTQFQLNPGASSGGDSGWTPGWQRHGGYQPGPIAVDPGGPRPGFIPQPVPLPPGPPKIPQPMGTPGGPSSGYGIPTPVTAYDPGPQGQGYGGNHPMMGGGYGGSYGGSNPYMGGGQGGGFNAGGQSPGYGFAPHPMPPQMPPTNYAPGNGLLGPRAPGANPGGPPSGYGQMFPKPYGLS